MAKGADAGKDMSWLGEGSTVFPCAPNFSQSGLFSVPPDGDDGFVCVCCVCYVVVGGLVPAHNAHAWDPTHAAEVQKPTWLIEPSPIQIPAQIESHAMASRCRVRKRAKVEKMLHTSEVLWVERIMFLTSAEIMFTKEHCGTLLDSVQVIVPCSHHDSDFARPCAL